MKKTYKFLSNKGVPLVAQKFRRNLPCPCGSGKKLKNCCNKQTNYFFSRDPNAVVKPVAEVLEATTPKVPEPTM